MNAATARTRRDARTLVAAWLFASVVRALLTRWIPTPQIVPDELRFIAITSDVVHGRLRGSLSMFSDYPFDLYPALLAPFLRVLPAHAYAAIKVFNAFLICSACFPAWLLARRVLPFNWARTVGILTLCLPGLSYASTVMAENLYAPLMLWTIELGLRWMTTRQIRWGFILAGLEGALILTKPQGVYVLAGLAALPFVPAFGGSLRCRGAWLLKLSGSAAAAGILFVLMGYVRHGSELWGQLTVPRTWLGFYARCLVLPGPIQWANEGREWAAHLLASGGELLPVVGMGAFLAVVDAGIHGRRRATRLLAPLVAGLWLLFTHDGIRLALYFDGAFNLHERYTAQLAPLLVVLVAETFRRHSATVVRACGLLAAALGSIICVLLWSRIRTPHVVNDSPGLSWIVPVPAEHVLAVLLLVGAVATIALIFLCRRPRVLACVAAAAMGATSVGMTYSQHQLAAAEHERKMKLVPFAQKLAARGDQVFFLMNELDIWQIWMAEAFTNEGEGKAYCFGPDNALCLPTPLLADGEIEVLAKLPPGSVLVTSDAIGLDAPRVDSQGPYRAYRLTGRPVRLLSQEIHPWPYP